MSPATEKSSTAAGWYTIGQMRAWEKNPKKHPDSNVADIARSVRRFGFVAPVVVWGSRGQIVAGHGRYLAAQMILRADPGAYLATDAPGPALIPVRVVEFASETEANAYALADNRLTEANPMEPLDVAAILKEIQDAGGDVEVPGWTEAEIAAMIGGQEPEPDGTGGEDAGAEEPPAEPVSRAGEVYELGPHRLVCGDSLDSRTIEKVMGGSMPDIVCADPPYGMRLKTDYTGMKAGNSKKWDSKKWDEVVGDHEDFDPSSILDHFRSVAEIFMWGADYYINRLPLAGSWLVWDKRDGVEDVEWSTSSFELCWSKTKHRRDIIRSRWMGVIGMEQEGGKRLHPTQKSIAVIRWIIERYAPEGGVVWDGFGGSGTTLIACAKTGRIARVIEIDPRYCDVIRRRWTKYAISAGVDPGPGRLDA